MPTSIPVVKPYIIEHDMKEAIERAPKNRTEIDDINFIDSVHRTLLNNENFDFIEFNEYYSTLTNKTKLTIQEEALFDKLKEYFHNLKIMINSIKNPGSKTNETDIEKQIQELFQNDNLHNLILEQDYINAKKIYSEKYNFIKNLNANDLTSQQILDLLFCLRISTYPDIDRQKLGEGPKIKQIIYNLIEKYPNEFSSFTGDKSPIDDSIITNIMKNIENKNYSVGNIERIIPNAEILSGIDLHLCIITEVFDNPGFGFVLGFFTSSTKNTVVLAPTQEINKELKEENLLEEQGFENLNLIRDTIYYHIMQNSLQKQAKDMNNLVGLAVFLQSNGYNIESVLNHGFKR